MTQLRLLLIAVVLSGCSIRYNVVSSAEFPAQVLDCAIKVLTTIPEGYAEVGFLETTGWNAKNTKELLAAMRPEICQAGGDAIVTQVNAHGSIVRAVILKRLAER